ncbi:MAG: site-specific integrase [Xanthobacteraceae bacterium]|nr:site-specific integrase [Xanthobacteraceae bacterium]
MNDRIRTVCRFYSWAHRRGLIEAVPFDYVEVSLRSVRRQGMLAHLDHRPATVMANILTVSEVERLPRPLRVDQLQSLFRHLPSPYDLIAEWALATGMRRKELCGLQLHQVPDVAHLDIDEDPLIEVPLTVTKGDRPRTVYPPLRLIDRTHWYAGERRAALVKHRRRTRAGYRLSSALFLNSNGPSVESEVFRRVRRGLQSAELTGSGHWLRHTFAMTMLVRLQKQAATTPDLNPLKIVRGPLGHASIQSTAIYLRCVELHADTLAESLAYLRWLVPHGRA